MRSRHGSRVRETSTSHTDRRLLVTQDVRTTLLSLGALIMMETSSSADPYGRLTGNTAVGEEEDVRREAPLTGRPREPDAVTRGSVATHRKHTRSVARSAVLGMFTALGPFARRETRV